MSNVIPFKRCQPPQSSELYQSSQSTIDRFYFLVRKGDADRLSAWLEERPRDAKFLFKKFLREETSPYGGGAA